MHLDTGIVSESPPVKLRQILRHGIAHQLNRFVTWTTVTINQVCPLSSSCDLAIAQALRERLEQERLINQVTTQIRLSLELPVILQTAVEEVRRVLQADRIVILQFAPDPAIYVDPTEAETIDPASVPSEYGKVTYEARSSDRVHSVLHLDDPDQCFAAIPDYRDKYQKGFVQQVDDITRTYHHEPCLIQFLERAQIRSKLIVPIVVQEDLWGLLIAHQCFAPRRWEEPEGKFLYRIAEHLAIAIQQTQLYAQVRQQAQTLEQRVIERTQELRDALSVTEAANLAKAEFLAMMSHELRTPLTCVIGMANTLLRLPPGAEGERFLSRERQREYLTTIQHSGEHLLELINDILDLSQVEAGRMILDIQTFSLSQLASETVRILKSRAIQNQIQLRTELDFLQTSTNSAPSDSSTFTADPRRLKQILLNLLSNAIKFTPPGGQVTLRVWKEDTLAVFQVQDTGIGIAEEHRPLLFEKFRQLDMSRQRRYEGTGLGLALTKQLVELHNGWIEVESKVGVGSTFTVWIPRQDVETTRTELPAPTIMAPLHPTSGRVVLVEDQDETATLICDLLTAAGYHVIWMVKGSAVIQQIEILQPLIVLLNIHLDWLNSQEVLQLLRNNPLTQEIQILALTPIGFLNQQEDWITAGANACLEVPIAQPEALLDKVTLLGAPPQASPQPVPSTNTADVQE